MKLPDGPWTVVAKREVRAGSQAGSSGSPAQLWLVLVRIDAGALTALLQFRTPANTFIGVSRWNDEPCKGVVDPLVIDTMKQTFAMPECFTVTKHNPQQFTTASPGVAGDVAKWLGENKIPQLERAHRVYYAKYYRGDFFHATAILPQVGDGHAASEAWGRQVAAQLQAMVLGEKRQAELPTLP